MMYTHYDILKYVDIYYIIHIIYIYICIYIYIYTQYTQILTDLAIASSLPNSHNWYIHYHENIKRTEFLELWKASASRYLATFGFALSPVTPPRLALAAGKSGSSKMPWRVFFFGIPLKSTNSGSAGMISGGGKTRFWCMRFSCATTTSRSNSSALLQAVPMRAAGPDAVQSRGANAGKPFDAAEIQQILWFESCVAFLPMTGMTLRASSEHWEGKNWMHCLKKLHRP